MEISQRVAVVTGGGSGVGRSLCLALARQGAAGVVVADLDGDTAAKVAAEIEAEGNRAIAVPADVAAEADVQALVARATDEFGPIDLFCSNAGIGVGGGPEAANEAWQRIWDINVMAHVWAARHVIPKMIANGGGYLVNTASAAGLLSQIGSAPYAVTKHAAVGLAEWLALTYGDDGIKVSVLCPQAVRTNMTAGNPDGVASIDGMMEPETVADSVVRALAAEDFLILPHPEVLTYMRNKTADYNRWIGGMRKLNRRFRG